MKIYSENKEYKLYNGSMLDMLEIINPNSIDSVITDPPYELNFMNRGWDNSGIAFQKETWQKCFEVLKPGGYLLAFGGSRTFPRIACAIEDAGFEIRDTIMWLYGSGFPKSMNIGLAIDKKNGVDNRTGNIRTDGKATLGSIYEWANGNPDTKEYEERKAQNEWDGWGTCLKPAYEPIIVARKPVENSVIDNVLKYGVGGINIDECRVEASDSIKMNIRDTSSCSEGWNRKWMQDKEKDRLRQEIAINKANELGRFPSNVILTYDDSDYDEVCGGMPNTVSNYNENGHHEENIHRQNQDVLSYGYKQRVDSGFNDSGSAARYFYCAKASKFDRDEGLDELETKRKYVDCGTRKPEGHSKLERSNVVAKNIHPTVKPCELMRYLVRLVSPKGATILDCFNGSGSTGKAVMLENKQYKKDYKYIGIELTEEYLPIAKARIEYICNNDFDFWKDENNKDQFEVVKKGSNQLSMFDFLD